ncbi:hypothetical protein M422DRAFT_248752 [Sphaerobolus stellatus SS14]|nr:hypothetical protein M422DRAFT_248752 [Sphaerobolus stellatus SS14]
MYVSLTLLLSPSSLSTTLHEDNALSVSFRSDSRYLSSTYLSHYSTFNGTGFVGIGLGRVGCNVHGYMCLLLEGVKPRYGQESAVFPCAITYGTATSSTTTFSSPPPATSTTPFFLSER